MYETLAKDRGRRQLLEEGICHGRDHSIDPRLDTIQIHAFESR
jgi:hypothetical protein